MAYWTFDFWFNIFHAYILVTQLSWLSIDCFVLVTKLLLLPDYEQGRYSTMHNELQNNKQGAVHSERVTFSLEDDEKSR